MFVFCEYLILEAHRAAFAKWIGSDPERWRGVQILENTSQPGVYVEIWRAEGANEATEMEKERRDGRSWSEMEKWVKGGREGVRIWIFREVSVIG